MKLDRGTACADIMFKAIDVKMGKLRPEDFGMVTQEEPRTL